MMHEYRQLIDGLNDIKLETRLSNLEELWCLVDDGTIPTPTPEKNVNNHIHTWYSFSPYSPTKAVWSAYMAGLKTAGIMDHDSIAGAQEFIEAGKILNIKTTVGIECRVDMSNTKFKGMRINNPDQNSIAYIALHGIPHSQFGRITAFFKPFSEARNRRNRMMTDRINELVKNTGIAIDFEKDVIPISKFNEGGAVTERHLLFVLASKFAEHFGKDEKLLKCLQEKLNLEINDKSKNYLLDANNPYYEYDLLNVFKSALVSRFYIDATEECPDVKDVIALAEETKAISAYAYLGDIKESVTGDKKAQKFEDSYLDLLVEELKKLRFNAVTYMPSRNSDEQLIRIKKLCKEYNFMEISGEDINSPRQSFICEALKKPEFSNLFSATFALIRHEERASLNLEDALFSEKNILDTPDLNERIQKFADEAKKQHFNSAYKVQSPTFN